MLKSLDISSHSGSASGHRILGAVVGAEVVHFPLHLHMRFPSTSKAGPNPLDAGTSRSDLAEHLLSVPQSSLWRIRRVYTGAVDFAHSADRLNRILAATVGLCGLADCILRAWHASTSGRRFLRDGGTNIRGQRSRKTTSFCQIETIWIEGVVLRNKMCLRRYGIPLIKCIVYFRNKKSSRPILCDGAMKWSFWSPFGIGNMLMPPDGNGSFRYPNIYALGVDMRYFIHSPNTGKSHV